MFDGECDTSEDLSDFLVVRYGENETRDDCMLKLLDVKMTTNLQDMKLQDMKMQDMNMTDQKWRQSVKLREKKYSFIRDNITMKSANF